MPSQSPGPSLCCGLKSWTQETCARLQSGDRSSAQRWSWGVKPPGRDSNPSLLAVLVLCHTDGHSKPRVTSSWTVSDLDVRPNYGSSRPSASPFVNRMLADKLSGKLCPL